MTSFWVFAIVFLAFYSVFLKLRRRRERILALVAQQNQPEIRVRKPQATRMATASAGPSNYTCLIDGQQQQQYKRGSPEYELISDAIRRM